jgi:putative membrane protein
MKGFVIGTAATAITFAVVSYFLPQIDYGGDPVNLVIVSIVAGVINGFIKPIIKLLSLPLTMMTLGLFGLVINAGLLLLLAWVSDFFGIKFTVGGFPPDLSADAFVTAVIGGIALSVVGSIVGMVVHD